MLESMIFPVISVGSLAIIFGVVLGFSARKFHVEKDPNVDNIVRILPGVNCGGCGYPGCAVFAERVVSGEASYNACPPGGESAATEIAKFLGIDASPSNRKVAFVKCNGSSDNTSRNYFYDGPKSCVSAAQLATGGSKACQYSCIGHGSCLNACPFGAIKLVDSISVVINEKCTACGKCVSVCPKKLIDIVPEKSRVRVLCNSTEKGNLVKAKCRAGCIGCTICQKFCEYDAITVKDNIALVDYEKCTLCMVCVNKCPTKAIKVMP